MKLEEIVGTTAAELIRNPAGQDPRGLVYQKCGKWVPDEVPVSEIPAWLEANYTPPPPPPPPPPRPTASVFVNVTESGSESGRCRYTRSYTASGEVRISEQRVREIIAESSTLNEAVDALEEAVQNHESLDYDYEDEETEDHDISDSECEDRSTDAGSVLEAFLEEHGLTIGEEEEEEEEACEYCGESDCTGECQEEAPE